VSAEIKFCGLTHPDDAAFAASLGASYVGVIFAGGPRSLNVQRAMEVLSVVPPSVGRVGVFADQSADEIARMAHVLQLNVVQLHGSFDPERISALRKDFSGEVWPVCRLSSAALPPSVTDMLSTGDGLLLDAAVPGKLGGTGVALPWAELAEPLRELRRFKRIILAGGLRPENVGQAIAALSPDVVDVSSGVESAPGIKDHDRMREFRDAVDHVATMT
jgi:phosphoribosylanthranilate isomerase